MVVRLEGKVDGKDVIFSWKEGDVWEATVPFDEDGTYIVELTAYDEFGNVGFTTKVLVTFHLENMHISIQPFPWKAELLKNTYGTQAYLSKYYARLFVHECGVTE